jgi:hypothetical protein
MNVKVTSPNRSFSKAIADNVIGWRTAAPRPHQLHILRNIA